MFQNDWSRELDDRVERFQDDWNPSNPPDIDLYVPNEEPLRTLVLSALVFAHLELSIRSADPDSLPSDVRTLTEHYLRRYPHLALSRAIVLDLFAKEYKFRRRNPELGVIHSQRPT